MLEKEKFNLSTADYPTEINEAVLNDGTKVVYVKRIPYAEALACAHELVDMALVADEETGICYESSLYDVIFNYLLVKYYTNIDVSEIVDVDGFIRLYDFCKAGGLSLYHWCEWGDMDSIYVFQREAVTRLYEAQHSLGHRVKELLSGEIDAANEETRQLLEKLTDMRGALLEKERRDAEAERLKMKGQKPAVKTAGTVINFAKKN